MECWKDLAEGEKLLVIKEVKTNKSIAERINHSVMSEIGESVRIFGKIHQRGNISLIAAVLAYIQCVIWIDWIKRRYIEYLEQEAEYF